MDHLEKGTLDLSELRFLVLDEADEMLNMGFAEDVETILAETPDDKQVVVEYTADHKLSINKQATTLEELTPTLRTLYENRADKTIFVNADGSLRYGEVVQIIDAAIGVGLRVGIVTEGMRK